MYVEVRGEEQSDGEGADPEPEPQPGIDDNSDPITGGGDLDNMMIVEFGYDTNANDTTWDGSLVGTEFSGSLTEFMQLNQVYRGRGGGPPAGHAGGSADRTRIGDGSLADVDNVTHYATFTLPDTVGNVVQGDTLSFDLVWYAEQVRNNDGDGVGEVTPDAVSISASPNTAGATDSIHRVEVLVGSGLDGATLSSLTVDYPTDFDVGAVNPGSAINAGIEQTNSSITSVSVSGTSSSDGDTAVEFTFGEGATLSADETLFIEYRDVTNASTDDDYTVVVDVNGGEIGPGTLTITPTSATPPSITSTFDSGDDGWKITGDAQGSSSVPDYEPGTGNPAPSISATDDVQGGVWYFNAPGKYLADKSGFYGGTLKYDLLQEFSQSNTAQFNANDIELTGGGITLTYDHGGTSSHPGGGTSGGWTSYSVTLDETDSWMKSGSNASQSDIETVLGDLTELRIRGEYRTGDDKGYLDNVEMNPP